MGTVLEINKFDERIDIIIGDEGSFKNRIAISLFDDLAK